MVGKIMRDTTNNSIFEWEYGAVGMSFSISLLYNMCYAL